MENILLIEDNKVMRENVSEILELAGYKVTMAENGKVGLAMAKKDLPDLILCDIMMPELDGYGVKLALDNIPEMIGTPFIFLTSKAEKNDFRTGMNFGADDYLTKPFNSEDLLRMVDARIKKRQLLKKSNNNIEGLNGLVNDAKTIDDLNSLSTLRTKKKLKNRDIIFMDGDTPSHLYFIISGKVKIYRTNELGKELITEIKKEGDSFGYTALLDEDNYKEGAMAIENTEIALIPKKDFFQLLYRNNAVSLKFIKFITNNLLEAEEKLIKLAYDSARKKVAEALIYVYKRHQPETNGDHFSVNRENLSAIAGISPESISRNLTDFREEGLIESGNGTIKIINLRKLETLRG